MHTPQIIYIVLLSISLLISARDHGTPRSDNNFWTTFVSTGLTVLLLVWGGFFK